MKLSVIILNYNVRYFLEQCIISVQRSIRTIDAEIIVIDNNSPDDSCEMMKSRFPEITLIENKENVGFSKANNQAVKIAKGQYVCILNPDTAVAEDTFINSLKYAENLPDLGALGVYLMDGTGSFLPESKRNLPTPKASFLKLVGIGESYYANNILKDKAGEVAVLVGAFMLLKRAVYDEVNGFDEDYFMYGEDIDFSYKLSKAGYKNHYLGAVTTLHYKGESTKKDAAYLDRFYGAMQIFYNKHFKSNFLLTSMVRAGVFVAKKTNKLRKSTTKDSFKEPSKTYLFTEDLDLEKKLSEKYNSITTITDVVMPEKDFVNTCFVFDANYMSYSQIFALMKKNSGNDNIFRICPPGCNFILGSDQSDEKGSVLVF